MTTIIIERGGRTVQAVIPNDLSDRMADRLSEWRIAALSGMTTPETYERADEVAAIIAALRGEDSPQ